MSKSIYNYYMDETCHLLNNNSDYMVIGAVACPKEKTYRISQNIKNIKLKHGLKSSFEIKFTKISPAKFEFYKELLEYFLNEESLLFRCVIINKTYLNHKKFNQTHDDFYYKMVYFLFRYFLLGRHNHIYLDYKDTMSYQKGKKVEECLINSKNIPPVFNFKVQPIDSKESNLLQLSDLLIGLVGYKSRKITESKSKLELIKYLENSLNYSIDITTHDECKIDILRWRPNNVQRM